MTIRYVVALSLFLAEFLRRSKRDTPLVRRLNKVDNSPDQKDLVLIPAVVRC